MSLRKLTRGVSNFFHHTFFPRESNNQRPKILHPAGLSVVVGIFLLHFATRQLIISLPGFVLGFSSNVSVQEVVDLTNQKRQAAGLAPLTTNAQLTNAAYAKAADMFSKDYWAHVSPTGTQPWSFIKNSGYKYRNAGENLARDFSESSAVVEAWMNSPSHRENLMNPKYQDIGIAVVDGTLQGVETRLVVQMFGSPVPVTVAQQIPAQPAVLPQSQQVESQVPAPETPVSETIVQVPVEANIPQEELETAINEQATKETAPVIELVDTNFGKEVKEEPSPQFTGTRVLQGLPRPEYEIRIAPTMVSQTFGFILVTLILGTLVVDWVIAHRRRSVRLVGKNWAHLSFLGATALILFQFAQGKIL